MTRKPKTLWMALLAAFAMSAMASATSAQAAEFHSDGTPTTLVQHGEAALSFDAGKVTCEEAGYTGEQTGTTSPTLKLVPAEFACTGPGGASAQIDWNGCYLVHQVSVDVGPPVRYTARVEVFCPTTPGGIKDEVVITVLEANVRKCSIQIPSQVIESGGVFTNAEAEGVKDVTLDYGIGSLQYSQKAGEGVGSCATVSGTKNGSYTGEGTTSGLNGKGESTSFWVE